MAKYGYKCTKCKYKNVKEDKIKNPTCQSCGSPMKMKVLEADESKKGKKELVITKEIADKILYLDCREEDNIRRLKKSLMKLPFIKSEDDLTTDRLEELIKKIERKHMIHLAYVMRSVIDCEDMYSGMIKTEAGEVKGAWIVTVHAQTFWETLMKTLFYMYYYIEHKGKKASGDKKRKTT